MPKAKVAITLDASLLERLDEMVRRETFSSRSQAVEAAVAEKLERMQRTRLARECSHLDPELERQLADEGLSADPGEWPPY